MPRVPFAVLLLLIPHALGAQSGAISVVDAATGRPIEGVTVTCSRPGPFVISNERGGIALDELKGCDSLIFQHVSFKPLVTTITDLKAMQGRVELVRRAYSLGAYVVSANRWEQEEEKVAEQITRIDPRDIRFRDPGTAADVLSGSGEVFVQKSQLGGGSPMIRGFAANRLLIVVDGVRMNNAIYRSGNLQNVINVDANAIERAEVIHGPGSMTYGSDAIGGVMDMHLLRPQFAPDTQLLVTGGALVRVATASQENTGHLHLGLGGRKLAFVGSASFSRFHDLFMGSNGPKDHLRPWYVGTVNGQDSVLANPEPREQVGTGFDLQNYLAKVAFRPNDSFQATLSAYFSTTGDIPRYDRLVQERNGTPRYAVWNYGPQQWLMASLQLLHRAENGAYDHARLTFAYQDYKESRVSRGFRSPEQTLQEEEVNGFWTNLDLEKEISKRTELFYGIEHICNNVGSRARINDINVASVTPTVTRYPDGSTWSNASVYASLVHDPGEKLTVNGGLRYSYTSVDASFDTTRFPYPITGTSLDQGALTGSGGMTFRPDTNYKFGLQFSTGFRAPNIDDIGKVFDSEPGALIVPNTDLSPEYAYSMELSAERKIQERYRIRGSVFYSILDKAMVRRPYTLNGSDSIVYQGELSRVLAIQNAAQAVVYGIHIGAQFKLTDKIQVELNYNWQRGEEQDDDLQNVPLRHAPPAFGMAAVGYEDGPWRCELNSSFSAGFDFNDLAPSEQAKPELYATDDLGRPISPGWYAIDIRSSYRFTDSVALNIGLQNITDRRFRTYSSGIAAPGRNLVLALSANW